MAIASALNLDSANFDTTTQTYSNVATTDDGRTVMAKMVQVWNTGVDVVLTNQTQTYDILLNPNSQADQGGKWVTYRLEFYDQATGEVIAISSTATIGDLDQERGTEVLSVNTADYTGYQVDAATSLSIDATQADRLDISGTQANTGTDDDARIALSFDNRESIEFTLTTRGIATGVTLDSTPIANPVETSLALPLVVTEDFEAVAGAASAWDFVAPMAGWFTDNASGIIEIGDAGAYGLQGLNTNKVIEIEAGAGDDNLYTMIDSLAGALVSIIFDHAQRPGYNSSVSVLVDGIEVGVVNPQTNAFETITFTAVGTGAPMRVEFKAGDANGYGVLLDNISIGQIPQNQDPIAVNDDANGLQDTALVIAAADLLANDSDPDGDQIVTFSVQNATNGTVGYNALTDEVTFTPDAGYAGAASFEYTIVDDKNGTASATVNLTIEGEGAPTVSAVDDIVDPSSAAQVVIAAADLLANDTPYASASLGEATNGTVYYDGVNETVVFTPNAGYEGAASFEYTLFDANGNGSTATVNLTIVAPEPIVGTQASETIEGTDGNDVIFSGAGNDTMIGGAGADTFAWNLDDLESGVIATDTVIADFSDRLDLSDLLNDEELEVADSAAEALDRFLNFSTADGNTVIEVGRFGDVDNAVDHVIEIAGYDATAGNTLSDVAIINNLMNGNHLVTDLG